MNRNISGSFRSLAGLTAMLTAALAAGCATSLSFESSVKPGVDIAAFETFHIDAHATGNDMQPQQQAAQKMIEKLLREELVAKGYKPVSTGEDFVVDYVMYVDSYYQEGGHDRYFFDERLRMASGSEARLANPVEVGTLHIHLMLPQEGGPFMESIGREVIGDSEIDEGHVRRAIRRMLADVPSRNAGSAK